MKKHGTPHESAYQKLVYHLNGHTLGVHTEKPHPGQHKKKKKQYSMKVCSMTVNPSQAVTPVRQPGTASTRGYRLIGVELHF